jgi:starch synthase
MKILFASAENGALIGGKVGGIGDVVERMPPALSDLGNQVVVLTPSYGFLHYLNSENRLLQRFGFLFRGYDHQAQLFEIFPQKKYSGVRHIVVDHAIFTFQDPSSGSPRIYNDDPDTPFATDANHFALFCAAASTAIETGLIGRIDIIHLHDWHAALIAFLRQFSNNFMVLKSIPTVYTIHNLGIQGIRPLRGHSSSLEAWFPETAYDWEKVSDPRWNDCVNIMALGIRLSDMVHTVSPSYAIEIQEPSQKPEFYGGEGLESDLRQANAQGRLTGILNGCDYDEISNKPVLDYLKILSIFSKEVLRWAGMRRILDTAHFIAHARLLQMEKNQKRHQIILTCVGRVVEQKLLLFLSCGSDGKTGLESILETLGRKGCLFILGTGDHSYENELIHMSSRHENLVFLNLYSDQCARLLYSAGDLFLMPSSYEPCGISQLLAMREGQPCVVHRVGGLKDTVEHEKNGFSFEGNTLEKQVDNLVETVHQAIQLKLSGSGKWKIIRRNAAATRFTWQQSAKQYMDILYHSKSGA